MEMAPKRLLGRKLSKFGVHGRWGWELHKARSVVLHRQQLFAALFADALSLDDPSSPSDDNSNRVSVVSSLHHAFIHPHNALLIVTAISMESILVGEDLSRCAFVYGSLSFLEKLSCGIVLYIVEDFHTSATSCLELSGLGACHSLTRISLAIVPGGCALLGMLVTFTMDLDALNMPSSLHEQLLVRKNL